MFFLYRSEKALERVLSAAFVEAILLEPALDLDAVGEHLSTSTHEMILDLRDLLYEGPYANFQFLFSNL